MGAGSGREAGEMADEIVARLQALIGGPQVSEPYIRFRIDLLQAQRDARRALRGAGPRPGPLDAAPLSPREVPLPAPVLHVLLRAIRRAAAAHGQETEELRRLAAAAEDDPALPARLAAAAAFGPDLDALETLARRLRVHLEVLLFVGRALAAPCLAAAAAARSAGNGHGPTRAAPHRCPVCGSPPSIARLARGDGRRILTCGLCGSEWEAVRLACACCGTEAREALGVLRTDDAEARWIETCEGCAGYIKTVDARRLPEGEAVLPVVEEAATLHLDLLAEREGYVRRLPYVLSG
jgi:FdhE protein